jgi:hypothetical protein
MCVRIKIVILLCSIWLALYINLILSLLQTKYIISGEDYQVLDTLISLCCLEEVNGLPHKFRPEIRDPTHAVKVKNRSFQSRTKLVYPHTLFLYAFSVRLWQVTRDNQ